MKEKAAKQTTEVLKEAAKSLTSKEDCDALTLCVIMGELENRLSEKEYMEFEETL